METSLFYYRYIIIPKYKKLVGWPKQVVDGFDRMKYKEKQIFRKSSIDRVSSPEQLNDYIRVSNPSVWMMLAAVVVLLAGVCVWGIFGRLESKILSAGTSENGIFICYVTEEEAAKVKTGMLVKVNGNDFAVSEIAESPIAVNADMDPYFLFDLVRWMKMSGCMK